MKKFVSVLAVCLILVAVTAAFIGCSGSSALTITGYSVEETKYNVGDALGKPTVTANLSDGTTKTVSNNIVFKQSDVDALPLEDNKFTTAGEYTVSLYHLEEKEGYEIGTWKIVVKPTK